MAVHPIDDPNLYYGTLTEAAAKRLGVKPGPVQYLLGSFRNGKLLAKEVYRDGSYILGSVVLSVDNGIMPEDWEP